VLCPQGASDMSSRRKWYVLKAQVLCPQGASAMSSRRKCYVLKTQVISEKHDQRLCDWVSKKWALHEYIVNILGTLLLYCYIDIFLVYM